jgi:hypothetical protein
MSNNFFKLFIVFHKPHILPNVDYAVPIQAGAVNATERLSAYNDIEGDHIGNLNKYFAELTALYSIVKNKLYGDSEYWGLVHYRRYFCLELHWTKIKKKIVYELPTTNESLAKIFTQKLEKKIEKHLSPTTIILPKLRSIKKNNGPHYTVKELYAHHHHSSDWALLSKIIEEKFSIYHKSFIATENSTEMILYNMMIAHKNVWQNYANWVFSIFFEMMKQKNNYEENYQQRVYGFLGERLLQVYLHHHAAQYNFVYMPVAYLK